jgi:hypothetical protein
VSEPKLPQETAPPAQPKPPEETTKRTERPTGPPAKPKTRQTDPLGKITLEYDDERVTARSTVDITIRTRDRIYRRRDVPFALLLAGGTIDVGRGTGIIATPEMQPAESVRSETNVQEPTRRRAPRRIQRPLCDIGWTYTVLGCMRLTAGIDMKSVHTGVTVTNTFARTTGATSFDSLSDDKTKWGAGVDVRGDWQINLYSRVFAGACDMFSDGHSYFAARSYAQGDSYAATVKVNLNVFTAYGGAGFLLFATAPDIYLNLFGGARAMTIDTTLSGQAVNSYVASNKETKWVGMGAVEISFEQRGTSVFILPPGSVVRTGVQFQGNSSIDVTAGTPFAQSTSTIQVKNTRTYYLTLAIPMLLSGVPVR